MILFETSAPSLLDVENYSKEHHLYFSYIHMINPMALFLYTVATLEEDNKTPIDIIAGIPFYSEIRKIYYNKLKEFGIGSVEMIYYLDEEKNLIKEQMILSEKGKPLRIINPFPLSQKDFHILIRQSHPLIGCTGDQSFSEIIGSEELKIPFYEVKSHKEMFFDEFRKVIPFELGKEKKTYKEYLKRCQAGQHRINRIHEKKWVKLRDKMKKQAMGIAEMVRSPEINDEIREMNKSIQENFSVRDTLRGVVAQQRYHQSYPELKNYENGLRDAFNSGKMSLEEIWNALENKLSELKS